MFVLYTGDNLKNICGCFTTMQKLDKARQGFQGPYCAVEVPLNEANEYKCSCLICMDKYKPEPELPEGSIVYVRNKDFDGWNDKNEDCRVLGVYTNLDLSMRDYDTPSIHHCPKMTINTLYPVHVCTCALCEQYEIAQEKKRLQKIEATRKTIAATEKILQDAKLTFAELNGVVAA